MGKLQARHGAMHNLRQHRCLGNSASQCIKTMTATASPHRGAWHLRIATDMLAHLQAKPWVLAELWQSDLDQVLTGRQLFNAC